MNEEAPRITEDTNKIEKARQLAFEHFVMSILSKMPSEMISYRFFPCNPYNGMKCWMKVGMNNETPITVSADNQNITIYTEGISEYDRKFIQKIYDEDSVTSTTFSTCNFKSFEG